MIRALTEVTELELGELMLLLDRDLDESELKSIMFQLMDDGLVEMAGSSIYRIAK